MSSSARYKCPTCQRPISWDEAFPFRPFCSERCKTVDFTAWVNGAHAIAGEPANPEDFAGSQADGLPGSGQGRDPGRGLH
jgi:endogenous inhibitor of DNA gyrase (YacG/DUF329 family)